MLYKAPKSHTPVKVKIKCYKNALVKVKHVILKVTSEYGYQIYIVKLKYKGGKNKNTQVLYCESLSVYT